MYKGQMGKTKTDRIEGGRQGWVGRGAVVGENGDNCTQTIIKKRKEMYSFKCIYKKRNNV